jgi:hypothetical protein
MFRQAPAVYRGGTSASGVLAKDVATRGAEWQCAHRHYFSVMAFKNGKSSRRSRVLYGRSLWTSLLFAMAATSCGQIRCSRCKSCVYRGLTAMQANAWTVVTLENGMRRHKMERIM